MSPPSSAAARTREHILDVAAELFYWRGLHATGVDTVAAAADVAPTTLYRAFGSKDGLVTAYVERAVQRYRTRWFDAAESAGGDPGKAILALFDELVVEVDPADCRGCLFLLAIAELPDPQHPAHVAVRDVKAWVRALFTRLAEDLVGDGAAGTELGAQLTLIVEGVYGSVQSDRSVEPAMLARRMAVRLCDEWRRQSTTRETSSQPTR